MVIKNQNNLIYQPIQRGIYAWTRLRAGDFIIFAETLKNCYKFITLPGPFDLFLTFEDFTESIKSGTLEFVEQLPKDVYEETILLSCPPKTNNVCLHEK